MSVILVYKTDNWHSYASRDLIGVMTSKTGVVRLCEKQAKKEGVKLDDDQKFNLENIKQTQGYAGAGEIVWEEIETDKLL